MEQSEREFSRCEKCGKRLAYLGPAQPRPCPDNADDPSACREVKSALVMARNVTRDTGREMHPETLALMERSGWTLDMIDDVILHQAKVDQDGRLFRYDMAAKDALDDWINGDRDRAMIVAKWALDRIDMTACGTRTILDIHGAADELAREISEHASALADQDWEMADAE